MPSGCGPRDCEWPGKKGGDARSHRDNGHDQKYLISYTAAVAGALGRLGLAAMAKNENGGAMRFDKQPEVHVATFGFFTSFIWEMLQMPFFDVGSATSWESTLGCTRATFGDAGILVLAYTVISILNRSRHWMHRPTTGMIGIYLMFGLGITVIIEVIATSVPTQWGWGWRYNEHMPLLPGTNIGLVPILMWIVIPLITL